VCWTEVPETWRVLIRQRSRWHRGLMQTLWMYRGMLLRRKYGTVGTLGMPWFLAFVVGALFDLAFRRREWGSMERRGFENRRQ